MKKFLSLFLVLAMTLSMLTIPAFAEKTAPTPSHVLDITADKVIGQETRNGQTYDVVTYDGKNFLVVRTVEQFLAMDDATAATEFSSKNTAYFIFANDLDFKDVALTPAGTAAGQVAVVRGADEGSGVYKLHNFILEGNGYAWNNMALNFNLIGAGLFPTATWRTHVVRNVTINATCNFTQARTGVLFGNTGNRVAADTYITIQGVTLNANYTATGGKNGGLVGWSQMNVNVIDTVVNGNFTFNGGQGACFVGMMENTNVALNFNNCDANVNVYSCGDTVGVYLGMHFSANGVLNLTNCTSSGMMVDVMNHTSRSWSNAFVGVVGGGRAHTVTFDSCDTDMLLIGYGKAAAYLGSTKSSSAVVVNFINCDNHATILSGGIAGAWVAEPFDKATFDNSSGCKDNSTIIAASNYSLNAYMDEVNGTVKTYDQASGELAYKLAEAQKAAGVADAYLFGQNVGTDAQPKVGGATVNAVATTYAGTVYSNTATGTETVASNAGNAKAYLQTATAGENLLKTRVIVAMSKANLDKIAAMEIKVTFTLADTTTKTLTLNKWDVDCYYSVYADNKIAEAEDGCVLLAITVKDIPTDQWAGTEGTVAITMTATDADGNVLPEYTLA